MSQGWTKPCFDVIESVTRQRALTANAMLEYFRPLHVWLEQKNKANNEFLGWIPSNSKSFILIICSVIPLSALSSPLIHSEFLISSIYRMSER